MVRINGLFSKLIQKRFIFGLAATLILSLPLSSSLYLSAANADTCTPPTYTTPGVHAPTGASAGMFTYDCKTGLWMSSHYSYDPTTGIYTPLDSVVYTYDSSTGAYNYTVWQYSAAKNKYIQVTESTQTPPAGSDVVGAPQVTSSSSDSTGSPSSSSGSTNSITNTGSGSNNNINDNNGSTTGSIDSTGADSNNNVGGNSSNNAVANNNTSSSVTNNLTQSSLSGDASAIANTFAGDATTGDAANVASVMNLLQSTSSALGGNALTFVTNINGNVDGNLLLDPSQLANIQPAGSSTGSNDLTVNNETGAAINNNIDLTAASGDATVSENTNAGNATTGSAEAIANVVNMIDSAVSSGQSFLGVININGNLDGNIEVPANFVNQLLADNVPTVNIVDGTGSSSNNSINDTGGSSTNVTNTNNEGINNNVNATATSGTANVTGNTSAGNATTGSANTNITAFNLTGSDVIGSNDLLVFVNVVGGQWVGLILNAPAGTTAAELGSGITSDTTNDTTNINNNDDSINNNIDAAATSGNANVSYNTSAGNATSGNADAAVNLLNVENSSLSLSNWFGILFINVFGTWDGNFGVATQNTNSNASGNTDGSNVTSPSIVVAPLAKFIGTGKSTGTGTTYTNTSNTTTSATSSSSPTFSTVSALLRGASSKDSVAPKATLAKTGHVNIVLVTGSVLLFVSYVVVDRYFTRRQHNKTI